MTSVPHLLLATLGMLTACGTPEPDPVREALSSRGQVGNPEATVPPMCYTRTDGVHNPCWTCHTASAPPNSQSDWDLQQAYAFSDVGRTNHWTNLFADRSDFVASVGDAEILAYVREDNYEPLRTALIRYPDFQGYVPDLDLEAGFDEQGFARDGSGWRAVRYAPFPGTFWPTNGSADDVFVRLPEAFRAEAEGRPSREAYVRNLDILEAALTAAAELPQRYEGGASDVPVRRALYPTGTELLHSVRYLDPDAPTGMATRMKELRYMRKTRDLDTWARQRAYEKEADEKEEGVLPRFTGSPAVGLMNPFGWQLQGWIEDADGHLRLQTQEEHLFCMGCHSSVGVTVDSTFSVPRKVPGDEGWRPQDLRGIPAVPQLGHEAPEVLTYLRRTGGGDELRANGEMLQRFFVDGEVRDDAVQGDLAGLLSPSPERALALDKAYLAIVREQSFTSGRDAVLAPATNVHREILSEETGLGAAGRVYTDGTLLLDWSR
jgi:hypothetical protein